MFWSMGEIAHSGPQYGTSSLIVGGYESTYRGPVTPAWSGSAQAGTIAPRRHLWPGLAVLRLGEARRLETSKKYQLVISG
jgi:hypothetical protein